MYVPSLLLPFANNSHWYIVGGLDPHMSRHASTLLKPGCIFIGHGSRDFRIVDQFPASL
ncbi:hypothetical protein L210DRAFT_3544499 [Boletus edulis BED1]|uniref:Uncharacterized protein n=1 Tax=Boletus edulis BED1 TaxID=1328754 RepID=A0AAD4B8G4_BOLED|nr:hypothetical protein L210DRAFT_3593207 [Boletus edulis BED1]KAF8438589.1 hypothetical protein L210DRAFT_3544499 [Boletus edulis BED1]